MVIVLSPNKNPRTNKLITIKADCCCSVYVGAFVNHSKSRYITKNPHIGRCKPRRKSTIRPTIGSCFKSLAVPSCSAIRWFNVFSASAAASRMAICFFNSISSIFRCSSAFFSGDISGGK
ncbi:hypothetical protein PBPRB1299 [Photobacterium profundum SS9]|uniref:Uncharacterized protein n=1 Tax=Photobacterium profundum (strain SS9) TaxID=298386 RepID=Q6LHR0_PHOPR|nr:hypothetical protein PBPRB1299 [Photobacterium profundum SS9]